MTMSSHVQELRKKHQFLNEQVEQAGRSPAFDASQLAQMKKEKLRLKEEIERLSR
ncbi:MAG: YdcH family protein [Brevirhabdus sp.]